MALRTTTVKDKEKMATDHQADSGSLRVTVKDVFNRVGDVAEAVGELKGGLGLLGTQTNENTKDIHDHEQRIRNLEAWRYALPASAFMAAVGLVGTIITAVIR